MTGDVVIDASVAVKWLVAEEWSDVAALLRNDVESAGNTIVCPPHFRGKVANAVYQQLRRRALIVVEAEQAIAILNGINVTTFAAPDLYDQAFALALRYQLATIYDALYVAVAQELQVPLWTDDRRLLNALGGDFPYVRWIGRYSADA